ncbi:unnamed protein product [Mytilus coruscus]|uniref:EGF-like domain-containing protein n=1 Tax=Mytilus coruscus TaxID=42192 RepID=A0A6J8CPI3_MYTCO|nr:unnamed protein product [Mytilus coruscus]
MDGTNINNENENVSVFPTVICDNIKPEESNSKSGNENEKKSGRSKHEHELGQFFENPVYGQGDNDRCSSGDMDTVNKHNNQDYVVKSLKREIRKFRCCTFVFVLTTLGFLVLSIILAIFFFRKIAFGHPLLPSNTQWNQSEEHELTNCTSKPCLHGGRCSLSVNSPSCDCIDGYSGKLCEVTPCSSDPCVNSGLCFPANESYVCACPTGYTGKRCEGKIYRNNIDISFY